jgi:hypothetical protein
MDTIVREFGAAYSGPDGYQLSRTLSPDLPTDVLRVIWKSCNFQDAKDVLKRGLDNAGGAAFNQISKNEVKGWVEVYFTYWKAVGELLAIREPSTNNARVSMDAAVYFMRTKGAVLRGRVTLGCALDPASKGTDIFDCHSSHHGQKCMSRGRNCSPL